MTSRQIIKLLTLGFFTTAAALLTGFSFAQFVFVQETHLATTTLIGALIFTALFILQSFFLRGVFFPGVITAFQVLAVGAFFLGNYSPLRLGALLVLWIFMLFSKAASQSELSNNLRIRFFRVAGNVLSLFSKGLAIFFTVFYLSFFAFMNPGVIKQHLISAGEFVPGFSLNQSAEEFFQDYFSNESGAKNFVLPNLGLDITLVEEQLNSGARQRIEKSLSDFAGARVVLSDSLGDIIYTVATNKLAGLSDQMKTFVWIIAGILVYLSIRFILYITGWASVLVAFLLYQLLRTFHFFRIEYEDKSKEAVHF